MNLKRIMIVAVIVEVVLSFPIHFAYGWFPNVITSVWAPVNESIWEHMKILYTACLVGGILEFWLIKRKGILVNNGCLAVAVGTFGSVIIYLGIYLPIYKVIGEVLWVSILLMIVVYGIVELIKGWVYKRRNLKGLCGISSGLIVMGYLIFLNWTYHPLYNDLFYDTLNGKYGINEYICHN